MAEETLRSSDKNWLIKSSTRILGPYTLAELTEHLKTKQISIIDEVRQPHGRWGYIRENPMFMDIVRSIRDEPDEHSEETMTQSVAHHTMTRTDVLGTNMTDELTPTPTPPNSDLTPPPLRDRNLKDVTPRMDLPVNRTGLSTPAKSYGATNDSRLAEQLRRRSNIIRWTLIGLAVVVAVGVILGVFQKEKKNVLGYEELMAQAIRYKNIGLYDKSLQAYLRATKLREPDADSAAQMATVLISEDRQSLVGRRILERTLGAEGRGRSEIVDAYLGIAVSYMMDGDLKQAEDTLQKAVGHEPYNVSTLLNLAIIQHKKGNYAEAMASFESIYRKNQHSILALFGRALSTVEYARTHNQSEPLPLLIKDIKSTIKKTGYLRQELLLFQVYAENLLGDIDGVNQSAVQFLNQLPGEFHKYTHPLEVDWRFTQWDYLEKYCAEIYSKHSTNPEIKALRSVCLLEINREADASKLLQEAMTEAPRDPYVLATQASYLEKISRIPESMAVLKIPELMNLSIKNALLGKICMATQDLSCAQNAFASLYNQDRNSAIAAYGLAWTAFAKKDRATAYNYVRTGLQAEPNYTPLLELRDQLESE